MALYSIASDKLNPVPATTFAAESILERKHLQRMLRQDTTPLGDDLLVLCEEFGDWEDSNRRIDLLCLDKERGLVVVEIKRSEGGGHMELQAIRYAAMVSGMRLNQAIAAHARMLGGETAEASARQSIAEFLEVDSIEDEALSGEVRIILVAADFSSEITTSVIWLRKRGIDIRCVRLRPYRLGQDVLVDATQIIPLPEAADYEVKLQEQGEEVRKVRTKRQEVFRRFWSQFIEASHRQTKLFENRSPTTDHWISAGIGRSGFWLTVSLTEDRARAECYIRLGKDNEEATMAAYRALLAQREQIEATFGEALDWDDLPARAGCRISKDCFDGGWKSPEEAWPQLQEWLISRAVRLETALRGPIQALKA